MRPHSMMLSPDLQPNAFTFSLSRPTPEESKNAFLNLPYKSLNFAPPLVYDHTTGKAQVLVRSPKLSPVGRG